jgi:hypothetical protein
MKRSGSSTIRLDRLDLKILATLQGEPERAASYWLDAGRREAGRGHASAAPSG